MSLAFDQLSLKSFFLHALDEGLLRFYELLADDFSRLLLALEHFLHAGVHALVVVLHFDFVVLNPALVYRLLLLGPHLFDFDLGVPLLEHIAHEHLFVEGLNLVAHVMASLIRYLKRSSTLLLVKCVFLRIYLATSNL